MKQRRFLMAVLMAAVLSSVGCDSDVSVTGPKFPNLRPQWQNFHVVGTLTAENGSCLEATILYDGIEAFGARAKCASPDGCSRLELRAEGIIATPGPHTIAFKVLRQAEAEVAYSVEGTVIAALGPVEPIRFGPVVQALEAGEFLTFEFAHLP